MADIVQVWQEALPEIKKSVTGVGVWAALNTCRPVAFEEGTFVLGLPFDATELSGHLRIPATQRTMEVQLAQLLNEPVKVRIIDGVTSTEWELAKKRDSETRRLQEHAIAKARAESEARMSWEGLYEQVNRLYSSIQNKSLPQNRAKFYLEAVRLLGEARKAQPSHDDLSERNFARCIERVSQYSEVSSTVVAIEVLRAAGEL
ncbi:MAG: hypothetical protein KF784_13590 [Fimbriimonadaceae bacterium]|nr:hypothetical protein [Fimbriimonadaceae bacterium]